MYICQEEFFQCLAWLNLIYINNSENQKIPQCFFFFFLDHDFLDRITIPSTVSGRSKEKKKKKNPPWVSKVQVHVAMIVKGIRG